MNLFIDLVWYLLLLTFDSLISTSTALLSCTAQGRASWAAMVASNIKSLNLKFSVRSKVHPNLIWSAALKSLSAWSHFLPDDELKLYMKNPWDAVLNLQSVWPWPVAFQCWICSIIQECFVMPAPLGDQQLMPMLMSCGCHWRPHLIPGWHWRSDEGLLGSGFASSTERWHLLHPFIQLDNNSTCVALPWQPQQIHGFHCRLVHGADWIGRACCCCLYLHLQVRSFQLAIPGTCFLPACTRSYANGLSLSWDAEAEVVRFTLHYLNLYLLSARSSLPSGKC